MISAALKHFQRLELLPYVTPLQPLKRLSLQLGCKIFVKRDDLTPLALGGNKARKLEYLGADALRQQADTLITAGAIQSNHVRQTAALAAKLGLDCVALLENPMATQDRNYLDNGNRLLLDLLGCHVELVEHLNAADLLLKDCCERLRNSGKSPYVVPVGGSNALGALGYVRAGLELAEQIQQARISTGTLVLASGSGATHAGIALAMAHALPNWRVLGITVSRSTASQRPKVAELAKRCAELLAIDTTELPLIDLWDGYFAPGYGQPNDGDLDAIRRVARCEGLLLDPVYTGKAFAGLLDGLQTGALNADNPVIFLHTGGTPALFGYQSLIA
jgi:D-cysteine desulfhydrase